MSPTPPHPPRWALTALLAPLGEAAPDGRWLHPYSEWTLPPNGAPVLTLDTREQIGTIRMLVRRQGWLIGLGYVTALDRSYSDAMSADKLRPQIELDPGSRTIVEGRQFLTEQAVSPAEAAATFRFFGGTIRAVVAGDMPAFPDTRFVVGAHVEEDGDALGTTTALVSPVFQVFSYAPDTGQVDHGQSRERGEAEQLCRDKVVQGALSGHVIRITPDPRVVYHFDLSDL